MIRLSAIAATGAVLLASATLASCGFNYATDRQYTPGVGPNDRSGEVDVLAAVIVSKRPGSGTFVAGLSNGSSTKPLTFESLAGPASEKVRIADFAPITIPAEGYVDLASGDGVQLSGTFTAGDFVDLAVGFDNGETSTLKVPVVTDCREYADLDGSTPSPSAAPTDSPSVIIPSPTEGASMATLPPVASPAPLPTAFSCDAPGGVSEPAAAESASGVPG